MNKKNRKLIAVGLSAVMIVGGVKLAYEVYENDINVRRDINRFLSAHFMSSTYYSIPDGLKYSDFNSNEIYYVHRNDNKTIVSNKDYVEGYECLGIYNSMNSADAIFYYKISNGEGLVAYQVVSYDDIEGDKSPFNMLEDLTLIDENSPDEVTAYIPDPSIKPLDGYAKTMN